MIKDKLKAKKGFTIIEVVIVLAIAALIITIVLLAVSALQRSQRTKAAQDYAGRTLSAMQSYASDQLGGSGTVTTTSKLPALAAAALNPPSNVSTNKDVTTAGTSVATSGNVVYQFGGRCNSDGSIGATGTPAQDFAVSYWNESTASASCVQNK